jgi:hypothetical protein
LLLLQVSNVCARKPHVSPWAFTADAEAVQIASGGWSCRPPAAPPHEPPLFRSLKSAPLHSSPHLSCRQPPSQLWIPLTQAWFSDLSQQRHHAEPPQLVSRLLTKYALWAFVSKKKSIYVRFDAAPLDLRKRRAQVRRQTVRSRLPRPTRSIQSSGLWPGRSRGQPATQAAETISGN